jgi:hypothetical protein
MRPDVWYDRRVGDNVVRVRHFHNAPLRVQARPTEPAQIIILPVIRIERRRRDIPSVFCFELPCDCGESDIREQPPP